MPTDLSICNGALLKIGVPTIQSLSEGTREAKACNSEFSKARQYVLRLYPWGFASRRTILAPLPEAPAFEYDYQLQLPSNLLRIVELVDYSGPHKVEGSVLLANSDIIYLKYVEDTIDITNADSLFTEALEWYLGYMLARYLTESETARAEAFQGFKNTMPMAKFVQSTENSQPTFESYDLIGARTSLGRYVRDPGT
jgi:hypothetical protein